MRRWILSRDDCWGQWGRGGWIWSAFNPRFCDLGWQARLKEGWSTVWIPLWVLHSNVQHSSSNPIPHFAARSVGSLGCIRVEACPPTLETIMWDVKTLSKFPFPHSWRDFQEFKCIPTTNQPLNSSGIYLNNPPVVNSAYFWAKKKDRMYPILDPPMWRWSACNYCTPT